MSKIVVFMFLIPNVKKKQIQKIKRVLATLIILTQLTTGLPFDLFPQLGEKIARSRPLHYIAAKTLQNPKLAGILQNLKLEPTLRSANAAVTPKGVAIWSETAKDDIIQFANYTSPSTYTDVGDSIDVTTNTNDMSHLRIETAPTRDEVMAAFLQSNNTLHVLRCTGGCDESSDWSEELEIANVSINQACDFTMGGCDSAFDIAYEQLSGDFIVFYGKNSDADAGEIFYNVWDGSSWAGEANYTFDSSGSFSLNNIFTVAKAEGKGLTARRSDRILLAIRHESSNADLKVWIWDGSTFTNQVSVNETNNTLASFDVAWESLSGNALIVWAYEGSTTPFRYRKFTNATSTWDSVDTQSPVTYTNSLSAHTSSLSSDPSSDRIAGFFTNVGADGIGAIWKADGSTEGWTAGTEDTDMESLSGAKAGMAVWEHSNSGTPFALFVRTDNAADDQSKYDTWTSGSGFLGWTDMPPATTTLDDSETWRLYANPNNDEIMAIEITWDDDMHFQRWDGSSWDSAPTSAISTTLPPNNDNVHDEQFQFDFTYRYYSSWSRNWRFYTDVTNNTPSTALAAENAAGYVSKEQLLRLRMQFVELNDQITQTDIRKKLQYTSGCNPNTTNEYGCTWADVGDVTETSSVWRYASQSNGDSVCSNCNDNTALGTTSLTGSSQSGSFITDKDAAGGSNMDHNANTVVEYDYPLKAEAVTAGTTYYFRAVDVDGSNALQLNLRRQDSGTTDCLSSACTYPSVTIDPDITQNDFELWVDNDSLTPTDVWGNPDLAENAYLSAVPTTNDPVDVGDEIRIRMNFTVSTSLAASQRGFILQYSQAPDCTAVSSWTDVDSAGGSGAWRYTSSSVSDNTILTTLLVSTSDVAGRYNTSDPTSTNPNLGTAGQDIEWDWHLEYNSSNTAGAKTYCFRMIRDNGIAFENYEADSYPKVDIAPATSDQMRHGNFFSEGSEKGFSW